MWKRVLMSTVTVAALTPATWGQNRENPPPRDPPPRTGSTTVVEKRTTSTEVRRGTMIIGTRLTIASDVAGGVVEDIVLSPDGCVEYLVVNADGQLRVVPWTVVQFTGDRVATVQITQEKWREVPTFTATQYPTFDAQYRTKIYGVYNVHPGDRRAIRQENRDERRDDRRDNREERRENRPINPPPR